MPSSVRPHGRHLWVRSRRAPVAVTLQKTLPKSLRGWRHRRSRSSDSTITAIHQSRLALGRKGDGFRAAAITAVWGVHLVAAWCFQSPAWQESLPQWHIYVLVSWLILGASHKVGFLAGRSVWLVPLLDMPMLFWIESIHAPMGNPPAEIVGYTSAGFVILVVWTALALDARFTMLSAAVAGVLQANLSVLNGGNELAVLMSMTLMLVAGAMTVVTTQFLTSSVRDTVEARVKKEEALRISEEKDRFVSTVTHDFRTPLSVLLAALQSLEADPDLSPELRADISARALRQCRKMMSMTEELLGLAQLGARRPQLTRVDLAALARETVKSLLPEASKRGTVLRGPPPEMVVSARVDGSLVDRALSNLVDNAIRYGGAQVDVGVEEAEGMIRIEVSDDGEGIAQSEVERIFEPFHRLAGDKDGSGLGLAIVKEVAHIHGGRAQVRTTPGMGTSFVLALPRRGSALRTLEEN